VAVAAARTAAGRKLWRAGVSVGVNTDNRLMSRITLGSEHAALLEHTPLTRVDLARMQIEAARHSFLPAAVRAAATATLQASLQSASST
jgi:adenosine deaminase